MCYRSGVLIRSSSSARNGVRTLLSALGVTDHQLDHWPTFQREHTRDLAAWPLFFGLWCALTA